jgi:hypothetical protein
MECDLLRIHEEAGLLGSVVGKCGGTILCRGKESYITRRSDEGTGFSRESGPVSGQTFPEEENRTVMRGFGGGDLSIMMNNDNLRTSGV